MSFTDNDGLNPAKFIGFDNYVRLFLDPNYITPIYNTIIWTVFATVFPVAIGFYLPTQCNFCQGQIIFKF